MARAEAASLYNGYQRPTCQRRLLKQHNTGQPEKLGGRNFGQGLVTGSRQRHHRSITFKVYLLGLCRNTRRGNITEASTSDKYLRAS